MRFIAEVCVGPAREAGPAKRVDAATFRIGERKSQRNSKVGQNQKSQKRSFASSLNIGARVNPILTILCLK
jgi:hypothetical protein